MNKVISILIMLLMVIEVDGVESYTLTTSEETSTVVIEEADISLMQNAQRIRRRRSRSKSSKKSTKEKTKNSVKDSKAEETLKVEAPKPIINYVDLATLTSDYVAQDGDVISGILGSYRLTIADKATVTLKGVDITQIPNRVTHEFAGITCAGDATIILAPNTTNTVTGGYENYPGIFVAEGKTLTIKGMGSLESSSQGWAAGIGGGKDLACGSIVIEEGTIRAKAGKNAAAIGSGWYGSCDDITIKSSVTNVTLVKKANGGYSIGAGKNATCGTVTIADSSKVTEE
jgi:hypothetical protein